MNPISHPRQRGFTLIEMMTVITIIIILAGITVAGMSYIKDKQANALAKVQIEQLSSAIEKYKLENGDYPGIDPDSPLDGDISDELYNALFYDGYEDLEVNGGEGVIPIYLNELDPRNSKQTMVRKTNSNTPPPDLEILDPWGRPYLYRKGADANNPDYDLWSRGKDGETDTSNPDKSIDVNRDDVRNF